MKEQMCMRTAVDAGSSAKKDYPLAESLNERADSRLLPSEKARKRS